MLRIWFRKKPMYHGRGLMKPNNWHAKRNWKSSKSNYKSKYCNQDWARHCWLMIWDVNVEMPGLFLLNVLSACPLNSKHHSTFLTDCLVFYIILLIRVSYLLRSTDFESYLFKQRYVHCVYTFLSRTLYVIYLNLLIIIYICFRLKNY